MRSEELMSHHQGFGGWARLPQGPQNYCGGELERDWASCREGRLGAGREAQSRETGEGGGSWLLQKENPRP